MKIKKYCKHCSMGCDVQTANKGNSNVHNKFQDGIKDVV